MIERYALPPMSGLFTDQARLALWLEVEVLAVEAWASLGVVAEEDAKAVRERAPAVTPGLVEAAKDLAERSGWRVEIDNSCDDWDYDRAADYLLNRLRELRKNEGRVCLLSGGEVTVKVAAFEAAPFWKTVTEMGPPCSGPDSSASRDFGITTP